MANFPIDINTLGGTSNRNDFLEDLNSQYSYRQGSSGDSKNISLPNERYKVTTKVPLAPIDDEESLLSLYDVNNPDIGYFNLIDQENIKLSGSKLYYYKYFGEASYDKIYLEERNKVISKEPVIVWGSYDPRVIEENMTEFGLELTNDQVFTFNKSYIDQKLQRIPRPGDILKPMFQNMRFEIYEVQEDAFEAYGVYHYNCFGRLLRDSDDVVDEIALETHEHVGRPEYEREVNNDKY